MPAPSRNIFWQPAIYSIAQIVAILSLLSMAHAVYVLGTALIIGAVFALLVPVALPFVLLAGVVAIALIGSLLLQCLEFLMGERRFNLGYVIPDLFVAVGAVYVISQFGDSRDPTYWGTCGLLAASVMLMLTSIIGFWFEAQHAAVAAPAGDDLLFPSSRADIEPGNTFHETA